MAKIKYEMTYKVLPRGNVELGDLKRNGRKYVGDEQNVRSLYVNVAKFINDQGKAIQRVTGGLENTVTLTISREK